MKDFFRSENINVILKIILIIMVSILLNAVLEIIMKKTMNLGNKNHNYKAAKTSYKMVRRLKSVILFIFCVIASLFQIPNFSSISWSLLSGAGIISLILGYAAQKTLANFFLWIRYCI